MIKIDEIIHQPIRLQLMAALVAMRPGEQMEFAWLRDLLDVTDGNLGAHLAKLESVGYIIAHKTFVNRKPRTFLSATDRGRAAFADNVAALRNIMASAEQPEAGGQSSEREQTEIERTDKQA